MKSPLQKCCQNVFAAIVGLVIVAVLLVTAAPGGYAFARADGNTSEFAALCATFDGSPVPTDHHKHSSDCACCLPSQISHNAVLHAGGFNLSARLLLAAVAVILTDAPRELKKSYLFAAYARGPPFV